MDSLQKKLTASDFSTEQVSLTSDGRLLHENADLPGRSRQHDLRTVRGLPLAWRRLALTGRADVAEFRSEPFPVEYKRGQHSQTISTWSSFARRRSVLKKS